MANKYRYSKRRFLNDDKDMAGFILATVPYPEKQDDGSYSSGIYPTFTIGDCSDRVNLDFGYYDESEKTKVKNKLKLFRQIVNEFADALEAQMDDEKYQPKKK